MPLHPTPLRPGSGRLRVGRPEVYRSVPDGSGIRSRIAPFGAPAGSGTG